MGLFDFFKGNGGGHKKDKAKASPADKWADRAGDKRAQNYDRQEALHALAEMRTADAAAALMKRFTFNIDPSITDQEEKEIAFQGVVGAGTEAVEPVRQFAAKADSLAWPMKILKELLPEDAFLKELIGWLERWDTDYRKFIDPKIQLLVALEDHKDPKIREAVEPFLSDVNETARFHAVATTLAQEDPAAVAALLDTLKGEESFRVKKKICDGLSLRGWVVPEPERDAVKKALPPDYALTPDYRVTSRA
jgi:hypothetical protein